MKIILHERPRNTRKRCRDITCFKTFSNLKVYTYAASLILFTSTRIDAKELKYKSIKVYTVKIKELKYTPMLFLSSHLLEPEKMQEESFEIPCFHSSFICIDEKVFCWITSSLFSCKNNSIRNYEIWVSCSLDIQNIWYKQSKCTNVKHLPATHFKHIFDWGIGEIKWMKIHL